jgi:long-chain fatty acid transport protein
MSRAEVSVGDAILAPRGHMTQPDGNTVHEQNNEYNIPNFYAVVPVTSKLSLGAGLGSYWGTGTNWGPNSPLQYATTQANITNVDDSLVASYKVTNQWSLAASLDNDYSKADESYNFPNPTQSAGGLQLKANDDAFGYRLATMYKINDQNQVGLMYRSRINHTYDGNVYASNIGGYYQGAIPGLPSSFETKAEEKSVLPQSVMMGYSFKPTTKWKINLDLEWVDWSSTKYQTLTYPNATPQEAAFLGLGVNPTPADWHSAWSESIGTEYSVTDRFRVRLGYYHHEGVIPDATFNPAIPDSNSNGYTTGVGFDITKNLTIDIAYNLLVYDSRSIINSVSSGFGGNVDGKYSQYMNIGLVSLTYKF